MKPVALRARLVRLDPVRGWAGLYESERSTGGAAYELERFEVEGGLSASLGKNVNGLISGFILLTCHDAVQTMTLLVLLPCDFN